MKNWFLQKNDSEQKIIVIFIIFIFLLLFYTYFYLPIQKNNTHRKGNIADIEAEITTMQSLAQQVAKFSPIVSKIAVIDDSKLMILIEQMAKQQQLSLSSIKSQSENKVLVSLNGVSFNAAIRWLDVLQTQHHITISHLTVEAEKKGLTNMSVIISH